MDPVQAHGIFWEHGHRTLGTLVGLCIIGLNILLWPAPRGGGRSLRNPALALLAMVIIQGALGGVTVLFKLPTLVSTAHLGLSMIVLMTLVWLCRATWLRVRPLPEIAPGMAAAAAPARALLMVTVSAVYVQIVLGALVRHTGSSAAAGLGIENALLGTDPNTGLHALLPTSGPAMLNVIHRYIALLIALKVALCCARCFVRLSEAGPLRPPAALIWAPLFLVVLQIAIGVGMLAMYLNFHMQTAHLAAGALLLASLWYLAAHIGRPQTAS
jgi:heme A synthase